jgi:inhibitor of KinA
VVVHYDPLAVAPGVTGESAYTRLTATLRSELSELGNFAPPDSPLVEIPVCYGGAFGPDLDDVARKHAMTTDEVVRRHAAAEYLVYMVGFVPGFAYLGGLAPELATPRRAEPRTHVPAGTVGIGGSQTGVYPMVSPGGWNLIGRAAAHLFDANRQPAALLAIGDRVRFRPISLDEFRASQVNG